MKPRRMSIAAAFVLFLAASGEVQAQWPGPWWPTQGWYLYPRYSQLERLPYFALFPPVYYSRPTYWTYGCSPFARLPGTCSDSGETRRNWDVSAPRNFGCEEGCNCDEVTRVEPLVIRNPFVPQRESAKAPEGQNPVAPLVIRNPYVAQPAQALSAEQESPGGSVPVAQLSASPIATSHP